jgi:DNA-binding response OmpR family regulator
MRILVVEDDTRLAEPLAAALRSQRHTVDVALDGDAGLELCEAEDHDIVLLDLMLPKVGGLEICRALRKRRSRTMVMMMTARDSVTDKVAALDEGADDYIVKPFDLEELLARIRALSRRGAEGRGPVFSAGRLELDQAALEVRYAGRLLDLTRTEYAILETMLRHPTRVFSSDLLYQRVGNLEGRGTAAAIKSHIANLRKKLREAGCRHEAIVTVYGFGYRLAGA